MNVKTAKPIRPKFCVGPQMAPGRVLNDKIFKYLSPSKFFVKIRDFFVLFNDVHKDNMFTINNSKSLVNS